VKSRFFALGALVVGSISITGCSSGKTVPSEFIKSDVIENYYGYYQIEVKLLNGKVEKVNILKTPDGESKPYSDFALPELIKNSIGVVNSSEVQSVTGASYTSDGYRLSLQSALDKQ
jgi:uncharacterized protein with FMN-binding domain